MPRLTDAERARDERFALEAAWMARLNGCAWAFDFSNLPADDGLDDTRPYTSGVIRGYRPLSTRALAAARPLLDTLQADVHSR